MFLTISVKLFLFIFLCYFKFTYSQTNNGMTLQFLFDTTATNTGSLSGSSIVNTIGSPTVNSAVSAVTGKKSVFFNNPSRPNTMSANYYKASNSHSVPMTVMLWLRTDLSYFMTVIGLNSNSCSGPIGFQLDIETNGHIQLHICLPGCFSLYSTIQANTWTHIAFTISSLYVVKLYKNGIYIAQGTGTSNFQTNSFQSLFIGGAGNCARGFHGYIQDLRMYNRELPVEEILFIYNAFMCINNTYWNSLTNLCTACPLGSNSTGTDCTCHGNTYFNSQLSTCEPYFNHGVIGDAALGIQKNIRFQSHFPRNLG
jgi:hypothetical protein